MNLTSPQLQRTAMTWTKPHCGVQHLHGFAPGVRQVTVTEYPGGGAMAVAIKKDSFESLWEQWFDSAEEARDGAETYLRGIPGWTGLLVPAEGRQA